LYQLLVAFEELMRPEEGFLIDRLRGVARADGYRSKERAWHALVGELQAYETSVSPVTRALAERVRVLHELFVATGWVRRSSGSASLPRWLCLDARAAALRDLPAETFRDQEAHVVGLMREWLKARRDPRRRRELELELRFAIRDGRLDERLAIAYGPGWLVSRVVPARVFTELALDTREVVTGVRGEPFPTPEPVRTTARDVWMLLFPGESRDEPIRRLDADAQVVVTPLRTTKRSQQVLVSWD
jgi:hypothetical protein